MNISCAPAVWYGQIFPVQITSMESGTNVSPPPMHLTRVSGPAMNIRGWEREDLTGEKRSTECDSCESKKWLPLLHGWHKAAWETWRKHFWKCNPKAGWNFSVPEIAWVVTSAGRSFCFQEIALPFWIAQMFLQQVGLWRSRVLL